MKGRLRAFRPLALVAMALTVLVVSPIALRTASAARHTGALFTTDSTCTTQNENHYENRGTVFLHGTNLTDGEYYVQVTEPNGTVLGTSADPAAGDQTPITVVDGEIEGCPRLWDLVVKASDHTRGYDATGNNGGVYRVEISQDPDFSPRKSDNFKVANNECEPGETAPDCNGEPPPVGDVDLTPAVDTNPVGTNHTVTAHVTDTEGDDFEGAGVRFEVWRSGAQVTSGSDTTDVNGLADFTYTGPATAAQDTIFACTNPNGSLPSSCSSDGVELTSGVVGDKATKNWEEQPPTVGTVDLTPAVDTNPVGTNHTVTAHVTDTEGDDFEGAGVRFEVWRSGAQVTSGSDTTDVNGLADFTYTGPATAAQDTIFACTNPNGSLPSSCSSDGVELTSGVVGDKATKNWEEQPPTVGTVDLTPAVDTNPVGTNHTVTAHVTDTEGDDFEGAGVRFEVWRSGAQVTSGSDTTDVNGLADFTYTGPATAAQDTIFACTNPNGSLPSSCSSDGVELTSGVVGDKATKNWEEQPPTVGTVDLTPAVDTNPVGTNHTVTAHVTDTEGDDFEGAGVRFEVWRSGAQVTSGSDTTDVNGLADFTYTGPATAAQDTIFACTNPNGSLPSSCSSDGVELTSGVVGDIATKTWEEGGGGATFSCRASVLRIEDNPILQGLLGEDGDPFEPFVANRPGDPCATDDDGLLQAIGLTGGPEPVLPGVDGDIILGDPSAGDPGQVTLGVLNNKTSSGTNSSSAESNVLVVSLHDASGEGLDIHVLRSTASADCAGGSGSSEILSINGEPADLNGPQEPISLGPLGTLYLNYGANEPTGDGGFVQTQRAVWLDGTAAGTGGDPSPLGSVIVGEAIADRHGACAA